MVVHKLQRRDFKAISHARLYQSKQYWEYTWGLQTVKNVARLGCKFELDQPDARDRKLTQVHTIRNQTESNCKSIEISNLKRPSPFGQVFISSYIKATSQRLGHTLQYRTQHRAQKSCSASEFAGYCVRCCMLCCTVSVCPNLNCTHGKANC